jgi:agmatinase
MSDPADFLDMPGAKLAAADVAILSVPWEGTVSFGAGTARGPEAILRAGPHLETFDEELEWDADGALKVCTLPAIEVGTGERPESYLARVEKTCAALGLMPPFPLALGGEHSITSAVMAGLRDDWSDVSVVHIDAHADLRDEYSGSRLNHACAMRRVLDLGVKRLVSIGIRSCTSEEFRLARDDERIETVYAHQMRDRARWNELIVRLRDLEGPVYLTIDVDGLDCTLCPGTGTPQPGGLTWEQALDVLRATIRESRADLIGADIVEAAPMSQSQVNEMVAAKLAFKILAYRFAPRPERR